MEKPSAIMDSGNLEKIVQRIEIKFMTRNHIPKAHREAHAHSMDEIPLEASDSSHEKGGTW